MIVIRRSQDRGYSHHGWLTSQHTFSFASYSDSKHMGFRSLQVLNQDLVAGGGGFPSHSHRNMEILTYVVSGTLVHRDSLGNSTLIRAGEVQRITAGNRITHSEFNADPIKHVEFIQIWIQPHTLSLTPGYQQKTVTFEEGAELKLIASLEGQADSLSIEQDVCVYCAKLPAQETVTYPIAVNRHVWIQVISGRIQLGRLFLEAGDGAAISEEDSLNLGIHLEAHFLVFDLS